MPLLQAAHAFEILNSRSEDFIEVVFEPPENDACRAAGSVTFLGGLLHTVAFLMADAHIVGGGLVFAAGVLIRHS